MLKKLTEWRSDVVHTDSQAEGSKRKKAIGRAIVVFIAVMLLLTFFSNTINNFSLPRVVCDNPSNGALVKEISGNGTVQARNTVDLYTQENMKVLDVKVKVGDKVKKGQVLLNLDTTDVADQLKDENDRNRQKEINLEKLYAAGSGDSMMNYDKAVDTAKANLDKTKKDCDEIREQYEEGLETAESMNTALQNFSEAERDYEIARSNKENALSNNQRDIQNAQLDISIEERKIAQLNEQLGLASVTSPIDGIVTELNFTEGSVANNSKPLYKIAEESKGFEFVATVDADISSYITVGDSASVTISTMDGTPLEGKVREISDNQEQRGVKKDVTVDIPPDGLLGGESGSMDISRNTKAYNVLVPNSAVGSDNSGDFVYLLRERRGPLGNEYYVQRAAVTVDDSDDLKTAITNGINMMDQVITTSDKPLSDGARVMLSQ